MKFKLTRLKLARLKPAIAVPVILLALAALPIDAEAKRSTYRSAASNPQSNPRYAAFVVDGDTGKILYQESADKLRYPASLTKMMTLYLLFESLEKRKLTMATEMPISSYAASRPQTNMSLTPGDTIKVSDAILALIVRSANDVAVVVSEQLGGTEENFAKVMTLRARQLGMKNTTFRNASGLPNPQQVTTAKDLALLGIALKKHYPQYYPYFSRTEFTFNGQRYPGHNHVMEEYPGADGLKTGFIGASGFNLVTTATRRNINLVGVVLGGVTHQSRDAQMMKLLDSGFQKAAQLKSRGYITADSSDDDQSSANDNTPTAAASDSSVGEGDDEAAPAPVATTTTSTPAPAAVAAKDNNANTASGPSAAGQTQTAEVTQVYETNTYVRNLAAPQASRAAATVLPAQPFSNPAGQAFVPYPKDKPRSR